MPLAEIRRPGFTDTVEDLDRSDQEELAADLVARVTPEADPGAPAGCHLDGGIRRTHALLTGSLSAEDVHSIVDEFGTDQRVNCPRALPGAGIGRAGNSGTQLHTAHLALGPGPFRSPSGGGRSFGAAGWPCICMSPFG